MSGKTTDRPTQCTSMMCLHLHNVYEDPRTPVYDDLATIKSAEYIPCWV